MSEGAYRYGLGDARPRREPVMRTSDTRWRRVDVLRWRYVLAIPGGDPNREMDCAPEIPAAL